MQAITPADETVRGDRHRHQGGSMIDEPTKGWVGNTREDGLIVRPGAFGFTVDPGDGRPLIEKCRCCELPLKTLRVAKLIAEREYPLVAH